MNDSFLIFIYTRRFKFLTPVLINIRLFNVTTSKAHN